MLNLNMVHGFLFEKADSPLYDFETSLTGYGQNLT